MGFFTPKTLGSKWLEKWYLRFLLELDRKVCKLLNISFCGGLKNCEGCREEFNMAITEQERGLHYATSKDKEFSKKGFFIYMVDDEGKWVIR